MLKIRILLLVFLFAFLQSCPQKNVGEGVIYGKPQTAEKDKLLKQLEDSRKSLEPSFEKLSDSRKKLVAIGNDIIREVEQPLTEEEIKNKFFMSGNSTIKEAQVYLFGENHLDEPGKVDQLRALRSLWRPNSVILFEGLGTEDKVDNCSDHLIFKLYGIRKWNQERPGPYNSKSFDTYTANLLFDWFPSKQFVQLDKLPFNQAVCSYWDLHPNNWGEKDGQLERRNQEMAKSIERYASQGKTVFVIAGALHLPLGDLDRFMGASLRHMKAIKDVYDKNLNKNDIENLTEKKFFEIIEKPADPRSANQLNKVWGFGSTKTIYDVLQKYAYNELIPVKLRYKEGGEAED